LAERAAPPSALDERIAREHLRLAQRQIGRIPLPNALIDLFLCWMLARVDLLWMGLLWLVFLLALQGSRWWFVRGLDPQAATDPRLALRRLTATLIGLGVLRGALLPVLFMRPVQTEHYMVTLVYVGMMAAAAASVGSQVKPFAAWSILACGSLALAWAFQGTADGLWLGLLIAALIAMLAGYVRDQGDGLEAFVKLAHDNEMLAESLRVAHEASETASMSKTRFFAAASHDLRQPLHALAINATTLELIAQRQSDPLIKELSHGINRALSQSNGLLDSLLDISNLDANAVKPQLQSVDLVALLHSVRDEFAALAAQKGLELRLVLPAHACVARTDPDLTRRILNNLIGNALKFTGAGSVSLSTRRCLSGEGITKVELVVADTGPGIPADEQERVFEEFYQIGNTSRDRSKGLGLGLSIVKRTAALLGVQLRLDSEPGQGTRIALRFDQADSEPALEVDRGEADKVVTDMLAGVRVLLVDDEVEILRSMQTLLAQLGCTTRCASGGAQALAVLGDGFAPQLLLVDHRLRGESGTEVIALVCAALGPVPAILVTGDTEPATMQLARAAGHRMIHKPVSGQVLARALRDAIGTP
jgi:signal transduction histidine kinase